MLINNMFKSKIRGDVNNPINKRRQKFNDKSLLYRMKIRLKVYYMIYKCNLKYNIKRFLNLSNIKK